MEKIWLHDTLRVPGPTRTHTMSMGTVLICPRHWPCPAQGPETPRDPLQAKRVDERAGLLPEPQFTHWKGPGGHGKHCENEGEVAQILGQLSPQPPALETNTSQPGESHNQRLLHSKGTWYLTFSQPTLLSTHRLSHRGNQLPTLFIQPLTKWVQLKS